MFASAEHWKAIVVKIIILFFLFSFLNSCFLDADFWYTKGQCTADNKCQK